MRDLDERVRDIKKFDGSTKHSSMYFSHKYNPSFTWKKKKRKKKNKREDDLDQALVY